MSDMSRIADELEGLAANAAPGPWARLHDDPEITTAEISPYVEGEPHRMQLSAKMNACDCGQVWSIPADAPVAYCDTRHMVEGPNGATRMANAALIVALHKNLPAILSALRRVTDLEAALRPFGRISPSSLYPSDGSENEEYVVLLRGLAGNPIAFTGADLARARKALGDSR